MSKLTSKKNDSVKQKPARTGELLAKLRHYVPKKVLKFHNE